MTLEKIKELRKSKKITQSELGKIIGMTATGISYWENGIVEPPINKLNKIANYFGVSINYLLGNEGIEDKTAALLKRIENVKEQDRDLLYTILNNIIDAFIK